MSVWTATVDYNNQRLLFINGSLPTVLAALTDCLNRLPEISLHDYVQISLEVRG